MLAIVKQEASCYNEMCPAFHVIEMALHWRNYLGLLRDERRKYVRRFDTEFVFTTSQLRHLLNSHAWRNLELCCF